MAISFVAVTLKIQKNNSQNNINGNWSEKYVNACGWAAYSAEASTAFSHSSGASE
jgi:hypothetical protein